MVEEVVDKTNTPEELVDVVDEDDVVIGQARKREVHGNPKLIHREIGIILYDKENRVLIQQRSWKKLVDPGYWSLSAAGHVRSGETPEQAVVQELEEELGLKISEKKFLLKRLMRYPEETHFASLFAIPYSEEEITIAKEEVEQIAWVNENELDQLLVGGAMMDEFQLELLRNWWTK